MFHCPVGVWVIEQHAIILSATVRSPTVRKLMQNLDVSDRPFGRLNAPKTTDSIWSHQSNHKRRQNLDSCHLTIQPPGRPAGSDHGQQGVTGHYRGEQAMVPQPYTNPDAHRKRNWYRGRNDGDSTSGHYQRQQCSQRSNDFHKDDHVKSNCELCGEINHTTQQSRHHNPSTATDAKDLDTKWNFVSGTTESLATAATKPHVSLMLIALLIAVIVERWWTPHAGHI